MVQSPLSRLSKIRKYFRTRPALGAADIDGWRGREHVFYLFQNNDHELHQLIIDELILPYVLGNLHPKFLPEFAGGVALAFLKPGGGIRPLLVGSIWRRCAARLIIDYLRAPAHKYFTTTYPNFMQCAGGHPDGATACAQLLNMLHDLPSEDPDDPATFINTDITNALNEVDWQTTIDAFMGKASRSYDDGRVSPGESIPTIPGMWPFMGYFASMRTTASINRFTDHRGRTHHILGTTGGQQGAPDEMQNFCMTVHPIWGRVLQRHSTARAAAYANDAYIYDR